MLNSLQITSDSLPPAGVRAVQNNATSIRVTWIPSSPPESVWIVYNTGGVGMNVTVVNTNSLILTSLTNGNTYTISVVTTSLELYSSSIAVSLSKY